MDLLKEQSEKAARRFSNATSASRPDRASPRKGSSRKPASPTRSRKMFPGPGAKKRARVWSPGPQGKRKKSEKPRSGRLSQSAQRRRAGRSVPWPFLSRWPTRGRARGGPPRPVEAAAAEAGP